MNISSKDIANNLADIFEKLGHYNYLTNPFLRISKPTPEQMKKYQFINTKFPRVIVFIQFITLFPINFIKVLFFTLFSIIFYYQYKQYNYESNEKEILFLSHSIGENITRVDGDQFFSDMPENLQKKNKKVCIIYTNHNRIGYHKNSKLLKLKSGAVDRYLIPKFLKPSENINYLRLIIPASIRCLFYGLQKLLSSPLESVLLIKCSITFYSRATYANFLVGQRVQEFCTKNDVNTLVITFEGHSYEQYITEKIYNSKLITNVVLYQHSPIIPDHFGVRNFLKSNTLDLSILITGRVYEKVFRSISNIPKYDLIGSSKANTNFIESTNSVKTRVLFAPEGTGPATISFLKLINYLCSVNSELLFSIRLHPNLKRNIAVNFLIKKLETKSNFHLSTSSLSEDLKKSKFVFYRSSAVGVQALMSCATPVFYGSLNEQGLNVLGNYSAIFPITINPNGVAKYLKTEPLYISKHERIRLFDEIFSKINYEKLYSVLNI